MTKKKSEPDFTFKPKEIPTSPGCYLFWDKDDHLLYVGKAKHLRKRVSSYFQKKHDSPRIEVMVKKIARIEPRIVKSEVEALILENNLIKKYQPRFNVKLRDDKNFVYLRITKEDEPKMEIVRRMTRDGATYIGPKTKTKEFRNTIRFCQKFFKIKMTKPSQNYYPHVAAGLKISAEEYRKNVEDMKKFLRGQTSDVIKTLKEKMMRFAEDKNFEAAAKTRDLLQAIEASTQKQTVQFQDVIDRDFIHFVREDGEAYVVRIAFRNGKLLDQNELQLRVEDFVSDEELIKQVLLQFYAHVSEPPREIYLPVELEEAEELAEVLSQEYFDGAKVEMFTPQKGDKKKVLSIALKNAEHFAERAKIEAISREENFAKALPELATALDLKSPPARMECYDVSHFSGQQTVASQVVFIDGAPKKSEYRRFHVRCLEPGQVDDFAAMEEVLTRRFAQFKIEKEPVIPAPETGSCAEGTSESPESKSSKVQKSKSEKGKTKNPVPDLIVIDGGKGQLSAVMKAVTKLQKEKLFPKGFNPKKQIIALAKREEQIFRPGKKDPLELPHESAALKLLQRLRDEAHRFAISFQRNVREKVAHKSILDQIPGIGGASKKKLLQTFGSVSGIRDANDAELLKVLSRKQMENVRKWV